MLNYCFSHLHIDWTRFNSNGISKWIISPDWGSLNLIFA